MDLFAFRLFFRLSITFFLFSFPETKMLPHFRFETRSVPSLPLAASATCAVLLGPYSICSSKDDGHMSANDNCSSRFPLLFHTIRLKPSHILAGGPIVWNRHSYVYEDIQTLRPGIPWNWQYRYIPIFKLAMFSIFTTTKTRLQHQPLCSGRILTSWIWFGLEHFQKTINLSNMQFLLPWVFWEKQNQNKRCTIMAGHQQTWESIESDSFWLSTGSY